MLQRAVCAGAKRSWTDHAPMNRDVPLGLAPLSRKAPRKEDDHSGEDGHAGEDGHERNHKYT